MASRESGVLIAPERRRSVWSRGSRALVSLDSNSDSDRGLACPVNHPCFGSLLTSDAVLDPRPFFPLLLPRLVRFSSVHFSVYNVILYVRTLFLGVCVGFGYPYTLYMLIQVKAVVL